MIQSPLSQQDLLFFVTLCRLQSLTVCAQKLGLSLSSASRILTHLREVFGEQLFVRNKGGRIPTSAAMALLPRAIRLLDCYDELFEPEVFDPALAQRVIRIATADMGAVSILTKVIPVILEKAPDLDFIFFRSSPTLSQSSPRAKSTSAFFPRKSTRRAFTA